MPTLDLSLSVEKDQQRESQSGRRLLSSEVITAQNASFSAVLNHFLLKNVAIGLYSTPVEIDAGTASDEPLPPGLVVGDYVGLQFQNVSSVDLEDSAGTPAALTLGTHFKVSSAAHGMLQILNLGSFIQPFKASYSYAGGINLAMFTQPPPIFWLRLEGINTADADKPILLDLYRVQMDTFETLSMINEGHGNLPLSGTILYDSTKEGDTDLGQFGRIIDLSQPQS
jgi:hypothetical protein